MVVPDVLTGSPLPLETLHIEPTFFPSSFRRRPCSFEELRLPLPPSEQEIFLVHLLGCDREHRRAMDQKWKRNLDDGWMRKFGWQQEQLGWKKWICKSTLGSRFLVSFCSESS